MSDIQSAFHDEMGNDYRGEAVFEEMLSHHTSLGIGGPADIYVSPGDAVSLKKCLLFAKGGKMDVLVLGGGTNVLISDKGFRGMVVSLRHFNMIKVINDMNEKIELFVEAGVSLQRLIRFCIENGCGGIEGLNGIPGTVGGAVVGNSGSYGQELSDVVQSAVVINMSGMIKRMDKTDISFFYRASSFDDDQIVLSVNMLFTKVPGKELAKRAAECLMQKKSSQPLSMRSAGCVYRNPDDRSAGEIIESAGCKGMRIGGVAVSDLHANFFINTGEGTASDFRELMSLVEAKVFESTGIRLEPEVRLIRNGSS